MSRSTRSADSVVEGSERVEWIQSLERWSEISDQWDDLAALDETPFSLQAWITTWWTAFGHGRTLAVCVVWRGDTAAAGLPLSEGDGLLAPLVNVHTPEFTILARDDDARDVLLVAVLERFTGGTFTIPAIASGDPALDALRRLAKARGLLTLTHPGETAPFVETTTDWLTYRQAMRSKWGSVERKHRKMTRENAAKFTIIAPPTDLDRELDAGLLAEASGWKGRAGTSIISDASTRTFYEEVARAFTARDEFRLSSIAFGGQTVAFDLAILYKQRLYVLKTGFEEAYSQLSPGLVLRRAVTEQCFLQGLLSQELLGGDVAWKRRFATGYRPRVVLEIYRRRPAPLARYTYRTRVRPALRRVYTRYTFLSTPYHRARTILRSLHLIGADDDSGSSTH